jgi:chromosome segregation ATPase
VSSHIDQKIRTAYLRLADQAVDTGEAVTVTRVCAEAGVSRASYYRSPAAAEISKAMEQSHQPGSRISQLTEEVRHLRRRERELGTAHAAERRELRETIATYANQIQALTLRNIELEGEVNRLLERLAREQPAVVRPLRSV